MVENERPAADAEELMRSRYTAYALGATDHLFRSWHPATRPDPIPDTSAMRWIGLEVLGSGSGPEAEDAWVEFRAHWTGPEGSGSMHERSRFRKRAGRWVYLDGESRSG